MLTVACSNEPPNAPWLSEPTIEAATAEAGLHSVLTVIVSARVRNADSVAVRFRLDTPSAPDSITPAVKTLHDSAATAVVPVLGLLPESHYVFHAIAYGAGRNIDSDAIEFATGSLPSDLPAYAASGSDPSPGFVVFAAGMYGIVIDNNGRVVWYRRFPNGPGLSFMAEPNGQYVARPNVADPSVVGSWVEVDPLGNFTRTLGCAGGLQSRPHDFISKLDGSYWLLCDEVRTMNLTAEGGVAAARVTGTAVQHVSGSGALLFNWSAFDHFAITDGEPADRTGPTVNWTHGNAIDLDVDGNLIVSFRNLSEITKINAVSGAVIWRMGGRRNQFTFLDGPTPAFLGQHSARVISHGALMILDNMGTPSDSRGEAYTVDESAMTARLALAYFSTPGVVTQIGGSVQSLPGGRTLASFGTAGRVEEYDSAGRVMWRIEGNAGYVFRAERIRSLYAPGVGSKR